MKVQPLRALRPRADLAARIASKPYDVLSSDEARQLAADDEYSFLHVIKPEIDLSPDVPPHDERVYATGRDNLRAMIDKGHMVRDERPGFYVYRLVMDGHTQTGILGAAAIQDYEQGRIKKHEFTRPEKEDDRVALNQALSANPGPVFLTYPAKPELDAAVEQITATEPAVDFVAEDGVAHTLWVVDAPRTCALIAALFAAVPATYVADGHHRTAAAARVGKDRLKAIAAPTGREPANYFLAAHFPSNQLQVFDYNRVVRDLNGLSPEELLQQISRTFDVQADFADRKPERAGTFGMYLAGRWYRLRAPEALLKVADPVGRLDVAILMDRLLGPVLGIGDPRTDARIDFVGGIRGMGELEERVNSGRDAVAFSLYPTSLEDVMQVADAGQVMPPKSTWFEPKLRSGLVVQQLDGDTL